MIVAASVLVHNLSYTEEKKQIWERLTVEDGEQTTQVIP
jgi:hypothetical protein